MENTTFNPTDQEKEVFNLHVELGIEPDPEQEPFDPIAIINEIKKKAASIKEAAELGLIDPIDAMMAMSQCSSIFDENSKPIKDIAVKEFEKHTEKTVSRYGFQISATAGATYSYGHSKAWASLKYDLSEYEKQMKTVFQCIAESKPVPEQLVGIEPAEKKESSRSLSFKKSK